LLALLLCFGSFASAQRPELKRPQTDQGAPPESAPKKPKHRTRAIGVIEFLPGGSARLVPIALWMDGKYFDASLYAANPEPLAVQSGTVYEALNYGETAGTFVVSMPKQTNGSWEADGHWTPYRAMDAKLAAEAAKQAKPKSDQGKAIFTSGADEGPPVLRRPGQSGASDKKQTASGGTSGADQTASAGTTGSSSSPQSGTDASSSSTDNTTSAPADSGRPTLKRPTDEPPPSNAQTAPPGTINPSDPEPDRPTLRRPSTTQASGGSATSSLEPSSHEDDPDRPVLSRGSQPQAAAPKPVPAPIAAMKGSSGPVRALAAISDAGKYENRPLLYSMAPEQQQLLAEPMLALALADLRAYAAKHPTSPAVAKTAAIKDYDLRFFDLDFSNTPTIVLTAKLPQGNAGSRPFVYYATVVAHLDINGNPIKVFSSITDTTHLDVYSRMELVDAIDADANGRGDLLFRQYSDTGISYGLYRVSPYNMEKVFEGGSSL
jgi:hypothetical protein